MTIQTITLGGGCFWCVEAVFEQVEGVTSVENGYCNGNSKSLHPTYEAVCTGTTGYAEVVRVSFEDTHIPLRDVLEIFFAVHDPTTLNRQGNDAGTQYRSGIYYTDNAQKALAMEVLAEAQAAHGNRVVTELLALANYTRAEAYHQHYFANNPNQGYCAAVVAPKVEKFRRTFKARLRT